MGRRRDTEDQFRAAVADPTVTTIAELCRRLGIFPGGGNYEIVRSYARRLGSESDLLTGQRSGRKRRAQIDLSDADVVARTVADSRSLAEAIRRLGGDVTTHAYRMLKSYLRVHEIPTSHMKGQGWARGITLPDNHVPVAALFDREQVSTTTLRRKLLLEGYKEHVCESCQQSRWDGQPIPLELDHVDGDRTNNLLENLRLLCPNCHALTSTYGGRNIGRPAEATRQRDVSQYAQASRRGSPILVVRRTT